MVSPDGRGLLIDLGSAQTVSRGMRRTYDVQFSAFSVLWGELNNVSSDLESLFHTLLCIVLDAEVRRCLVRSQAKEGVLSSLSHNTDPQSQR